MRSILLADNHTGDVFVFCLCLCQWCTHLSQIFSPWMRPILLADDHAGSDQKSKGGAEEENHSRNLFRISVKNLSDRLGLSLHFVRIFGFGGAKNHSRHPILSFNIIFSLTHFFPPG